uniref:G-protein coupled receptors family 1 profile domain-containing protein n=1 Tax=Dromaius novaehollandiae TaxID=8790 RepID=A0A8C4J8P0_DRONO
MLSVVMDGSKMNEIQPNSSEDSIFFLEIVFVSFMLPTTILGLGGNGTILWFLCFKMKRNKFTVYVLNLAIADFTFLFSCFITFLLILMNLQSPNTSFFLLTAISAEQCPSVLFPVWCHCNWPKHLSVYVCAFLWTLCCLASGMEYVYKMKDTQSKDARIYDAITIFSCVLNFLIFIPTMVLSSLILFITIQRKSLQQRPRTRLYITIIIAVMVFLVFAMPVRLTNVVKYWLPELVSARLVYISVLLNIIKSSANPLVYFCIGGQNRLRFREAVQTVLQRKQSRLGQKPRSLDGSRKEMVFMAFPC